MPDPVNVEGKRAAKIEGATEMVTRFRDRFLVRITKGSFDLPMLPEVATQVMSATQDEHSDAKKISALIHRDASLAGHVLKLANSPLYAPTVPIASLQQAVSRLGMKRIREIALVVACQAKVFRVPGHDDRVRKLFKHSIATAAFAQEIARLRRWNVEEAFLCGLLHDAGKPVLLQLLVDVGKELDIGIESELVEDVLEEMHGSVGGRLIEEWKLPERLVETIIFHHRPHEAHEAAPTAMMTNMADDLAHFSMGPREVTEEMLRNHPMLVPLNLYKNELDSLIARKEAITAMAEAVA